MTVGDFHPELRTAHWLPRGLGHPLVAWMDRVFPKRRARLPTGFSLAEHRVSAAGPRVVILRPTSAAEPRAAMLYMHGGGYIMGSPERDFAVYSQFAFQLGLVVVAVDYRLAPKHPYPQPLDDCMAAYDFMHRKAHELAIDPERVIIAGASAGGGLAAGLALRILDEGAPSPRMQHLIYPMLDDRSTSSSLTREFHRLWDVRSNRYAWRSYLGAAPASLETPAHASASRRRELAGLPAAWLGVGTLDLFHDETVLYANRLCAAGVPTVLDVVPGAFHGFDLVAPRTVVCRDFFARQFAAIRHRLAANVGEHTA